MVAKSRHTFSTAYIIRDLHSKVIMDAVEEYAKTWSEREDEPVEYLSKGVVVIG